MSREILDSEYEEVIKYLQSIGINEQKLQTEMADHLVIITSLYMDGGDNFNDAFLSAKKGINQKDLVEINENSGSFSNYPKFLGKKFLIILGSLSILIFITGLVLKYQHVPHHHLVVVIGRRLTSIVFLPLLMLFNFTEHANKLKTVLNFTFQFVLFQTIADYLVHQKLNIYFSITTAIIGLTWLVLYCFIPAVKSRA